MCNSFCGRPHRDEQVYVDSWSQLALTCIRLLKLFRLRPLRLVVGISFAGRQSHPHQFLTPGLVVVRRKGLLPQRCLPDLAPYLGQFYCTRTLLHWLGTFSSTSRAADVTGNRLCTRRHPCYRFAPAAKLGAWINLRLFQPFFPHIAAILCALFLDTEVPGHPTRNLCNLHSRQTFSIYPRIAHLLVLTRLTAPVRARSTLSDAVVLSRYGAYIVTGLFCACSWSLSHKAFNKLWHILHGNQPMCSKCQQPTTLLHSKKQNVNLGRAYWRCTPCRSFESWASSSSARVSTASPVKRVVHFPGPLSPGILSSTVLLFLNSAPGLTTVQAVHICQLEPGVNITLLVHQTLEGLPPLHIGSYYKCLGLQVVPKSSVSIASTAPDLEGFVLLVDFDVPHCWIPVCRVGRFWQPIRAFEPFCIAELACGGVAGFTQAGKQLGFRVLECSDIDNGVIETVAANLPDTVVRPRDVKDYSKWHELVDASTLAAGFPCQPWSTAGLQLGLEDPRELLQHLLQLLFFLATPVMVLENVSGFFARSDIVEHFVQLTKHHGYEWHQELRNCNTLLPQVRIRGCVILVRGDNPVARRNPFTFTLPRLAPSIAGRMILFAENPSAIRDNAGCGIDAYVERIYSVYTPTSPPWPFLGYNRIPSIITPTVMASYGTAHIDFKGILHGFFARGSDELRWYRPREIARLQGVPEEWILPTNYRAAWHLLGNAIPPVLALLWLSAVVQILLPLFPSSCPTSQSVETLTAKNLLLAVPVACRDKCQDLLKLLDSKRRVLHSPAPLVPVFQPPPLRPLQVLVFIFERLSQFLPGRLPSLCKAASHVIGRIHYPTDHSSQMQLSQKDMALPVSVVSFCRCGCIVLPRKGAASASARCAECQAPIPRCAHVARCNSAICLKLFCQSCVHNLPEGVPDPTNLQHAQHLCPQCMCIMPLAFQYHTAVSKFRLSDCILCRRTIPKSDGLSLLPLRCDTCGIFKCWICPPLSVLAFPRSSSTSTPLSKWLRPLPAPEIPPSAVAPTFLTVLEVPASIAEQAPLSPLRVASQSPLRRRRLDFSGSTPICASCQDCPCSCDRQVELPFSPIWCRACCRHPCTCNSIPSSQPVLLCERCGETYCSCGNTFDTRDLLPFFRYDFLLFTWRQQVCDLARVLQKLQRHIYRHPLRFQIREQFVSQTVLIVTAMLGNYLGMHCNTHERSFQLFFLSRYMRNKLARAMHGNG